MWNWMTSVQIVSCTWLTATAVGGVGRGSKKKSCNHLTLSCMGATKYRRVCGFHFHLPIVGFTGRKGIAILGAAPDFLHVQTLYHPQWWAGFGINLDEQMGGWLVTRLHAVEATTPPLFWCTCHPPPLQKKKKKNRSHISKQLYSFQMFAYLDTMHLQHGGPPLLGNILN